MTRALLDFARDALARGAARSDIAMALKNAGWTDSEIRRALGAYAEIAFPVPVPRPRPYLSPREAFVYLVMFAALHLSAWSLAHLGFEFIDRALPDPLRSPGLRRKGPMTTSAGTCPF